MTLARLPRTMSNCEEQGASGGRGGVAGGGAYVDELDGAISREGALDGLPSGACLEPRHPDPHRPLVVGRAAQAAVSKPQPAAPPPGARKATRSASTSPAARIASLAPAA